MKLFKIILTLLLCMTTVNAFAFQSYGHHGNHGYNHSYRGYNQPHTGNWRHNDYHRGYGYGHSRFGILPWVVGGSILFGAIELNRNQTVYIDNGTQYDRVDRVCIDNDGREMRDPYGRPIICGYEWIQR